MKLEQIKPNFTRVTFGKLTVWFSYQTPIAFRDEGPSLPAWSLYIRENDWNQTTGKHLNAIDPDKKKRLSGAEFESWLNKALKSYGL